MNIRKIFDTIDKLSFFINEQDETDYEGSSDDFSDKDDEIDNEFVNSFSNRFEMIADRVGGVVSFIKDNDKGAAIVSLEKIIEDIIKSYYDIGGEGNVLKGIRGNPENKDQSKDKKKKSKKKPKKKDDKKEKEDGDEGQEVDRGDDGEGGGGEEDGENDKKKKKKDKDIGESIYDSAIFNQGRDLSEIDVGYSIKEREGKLSASRILGEGCDDPFGLGGDFMVDIKRRSGVK